MCTAVYERVSTRIQQTSQSTFKSFSSCGKGCGRGTYGQVSSSSLHPHHHLHTSSVKPRAGDQTLPLYCTIRNIVADAAP
eukprot:5462340-Amphidinium_carterae.1